MRFIINFFLFGFIFYLISVFFPDAFHTLVSWAEHVYVFLKGWWMELMHRYGTVKPPEGGEAAPKALLFLLTGRFFS